MRKWRGEILFFCIALALYVLAMFSAFRRSGWSGIAWSHYSVFLPTGLMLLGSINHRVRSRILGWGIFSFAFLFVMVVLGAFVLQVKTAPDAQWLIFSRALGLYACLGMVGLYQLRPSS
jgi:hypothetical protein